MNEFEERIMKLIEEKQKKESIICPHCHAIQDNDDNQYPVTYWGEDGEQDYECNDCEKTFLVTENVSRVYETEIK